MMTDGDKAENQAMVDHLELARERSLREGRFMDQALFGAAIALLSAPLGEGAPEPPGEDEVRRIEAMIPGKRKGGRPRKDSAAATSSAGTSTAAPFTDGGPGIVDPALGAVPSAEIPASVADIAPPNGAEVPGPTVAL